MSDDHSESIAGTKHASQIAEKVGDFMFIKYLAGQKEHGGLLWRKNLIPHIQEEILDLAIYHFTHEEQMGELTRLLRGIIGADDLTEAHRLGTMALNLVTIGNTDGIEEEELNP